MDEKELTLLLVKACLAYPNNAPNFKERPEIFELWAEMLANTSAQTALKNLDRHIKTSTFFPTISEIIKNNESWMNGDMLTVEETHAMLAEQEEHRKRAVPMPEHIRLKFEARKALPQGGAANEGN